MNWLAAGLALLAFIAASLFLGWLGATRTRRHLRSLFAGRDPARAFAGCLAACDGIEPSRVSLAYRWVQRLVDCPDAPLQPADDLWADLRIDQGELDDLLESSLEWRDRHGGGPAAPPRKPHHTVADLMAHVLALQYEGFAAGLETGDCRPETATERN